MATKGKNLYPLRFEPLLLFRLGRSGIYRLVVMLRALSSSMRTAYVIITSQIDVYQPTQCHTPLTPDNLPERYHTTRFRPWHNIVPGNFSKSCIGHVWHSFSTWRSKLSVKMFITKLVRILTVVDISRQMRCLVCILFNVTSIENKRMRSWEHQVCYWFKLDET